MAMLEAFVVFADEAVEVALQETIESRALGVAGAIDGSSDTGPGHGNSSRGGAPCSS
jgi:hypothetical protein